MAMIVEKLLKSLNERRIRLGLQHGRITPNQARELLGVLEWAQ
jgi:hypothetical protein